MISLDKLAEQIYELTKANQHRDDTVYDLKTIREIIEPLMKIIAEAREQKKYLYLSPCSRWFSPDELERGIINGYYVYTSDLWTLRNPMEMLEELEKQVAEKNRELRVLRIQISRYLYGKEHENIEGFQW